MNKTLIVVVIGLLLAVGFGGYFYYKSLSKTPTSYYSTPSDYPSPTPPSQDTSQNISQNVVKITSSGFEPQEITIKAGESVTWENDDTTPHQVMSAVHPTHLVYPPLNIGLINPGESKSLVFPEAGTYKYHDHLNPTLTGQVVVQ